MIARLLRRFRGAAPSVTGDLSPVEPPGATPPPVVGARRPLLVDGHTRTWWSRGEHQAATLVEVEPGTGQMAARARPGAQAAQRPQGRPRGNPAFSEALFVELMRAGQLRRAFAQLSPECQAAWGTPDRFAGEQPGRALRSVQGVEVREVRYLESWTDPATSTSYADVAELDVEYVVAGPGRSRAVLQTVHLVPVEGHWRSVYHPPALAV